MIVRNLKNCKVKVIVKRNLLELNDVDICMHFSMDGDRLHLCIGSLIEKKMYSHYLIFW